MDARPTNEEAGAPFTVDEGTLTARDGLRLYRKSLVPSGTAKAHVAVVHGYGEHLGRYRETMERLGRAGYAAHAFDYRGHGKSEGHRAHVDDFAHYLSDLDVLVEHVRSKAGAQKIFVLGHSLGGLIVSRWLMGKSEGLAGAVVSSPFMALGFEPPKLKLMAAGLLSRALPKLHMANELGYDQLTHDEAIQKATAADPMYLHVTTARWFVETTGAQQATLAGARQITVPILELIGTADTIAQPASGRRLFDALGSADKTLKVYEGFRHEVLNEVGRDQVFADLVAFLDKHLG
ncbi:MAG: alpha/beta hydrolase [Myxococcales bacterium]